MGHRQQKLNIGNGQLTFFQRTCWVQDTFRIATPHHKRTRCVGLAVGLKPRSRFLSFKGGEPGFDTVSIKTGGGASEYVNPDQEYLFMVKESESGVWIDGCSPPIELGSEVEEIFWKRLNLGIQERTLKEISEVDNEN